MLSLLTVSTFGHSRSREQRKDHPTSLTRRPLQRAPVTHTPRHPPFCGWTRRTASRCSSRSRPNPDKPASWAYYASYILNKYRLQPLLLVVCQDRATAEWAAREVHFGPRQWPLLTLRPLVAGPHNMPVITDPAAVRKDLALATLSAITHATHPDAGAILKSMTTVLRDTPQNIADPIIELIAQGLGKHPAVHLWRKLVAVDLSFYKSFISEEIRDEGRAQRAAEDVLDILNVRGMDIPEAVRERVTGCDDLEILRHWLRRAVTAPTAEDIFEDE